MVFIAEAMGVQNESLFSNLRLIFVFAMLAACHRAKSSDWCIRPTYAVLRIR